LDQRIKAKGKAVPNIKEALINFQEFYELPVDVTLNEETIKLINTAKYSISDRSLQFLV
jgi:hypothetical protein